MVGGRTILVCGGREYRFMGRPESDMGRRIYIGCSPLSNNIYAGHVLKDGQTWSDTNKTDVTHAAIGAVCEHAERFGKPVVVNCNGKPKYRLTIEVL